MSPLAEGTPVAPVLAARSGHTKQRGMSRHLAIAGVVTAGVFLAGAGLVWVGTMPALSSIDICTDFGALPEGSSISSKPDLFPPGTIVCEYQTPRGEVTTSEYVPWFEWLVVGVAAVAVGLMALVVLRLRST